MKELRDDTKYLAGTTKDVYSAKYGQWTFTKKKRAEKVRSDMIKMIPFSFFIIIPGGEILIPAWVAVFPQGLPS